MTKPLAFLLFIAASLPFIGCTAVDQGSGRDTIFHRTEDSPRTGATGRNRYGANGTHSPRERTATTSSKKKKRPTRSSRAKRNSDPDGIVKPRDLDPEAGADEPEIVSSSTGSDTKPEKEDPDLVTKKDPDPTPATGGSAPYAEAVPGKYGLVYSPFKKGALVNVTDDNDVPLPPGTEVTDPHTGKVFRVP